MSIFEIRDKLSAMVADGQRVTHAELESLASAAKLSSMKASTACMKTINDCFTAGKRAAAELAKIRSCAEECASIIRQLSETE